jgi:hypothetical protein
LSRNPKPLTCDDRPYSVRAAIFLWIAMAAIFWAGLGAVLDRVSERTPHSGIDRPGPDQFSER